MRAIHLIVLLGALAPRVANAQPPEGAKGDLFIEKAIDEALAEARRNKMP